MPRPPSGCGVLYLLTLLGELEVRLLVVYAVGLADHEGLANRAGRRLVVVDELVARGIVAQGRVASGVVLEQVRTQSGPAAARHALSLARHRANQVLRSGVADGLQDAVHVLPDLPLDGVGPTDLAHVDRTSCGAVTVDRLEPAVEGVGDAVVVGEAARIANLVRGVHLEGVRTEAGVDGGIVGHSPVARSGIGAAVRAGVVGVHDLAGDIGVAISRLGERDGRGLLVDLVAGYGGRRHGVAHSVGEGLRAGGGVVRLVTSSNTGGQRE